MPLTLQQNTTTSTTTLSSFSCYSGTIVYMSTATTAPSASTAMTTMQVTTSALMTTTCTNLCQVTQKSFNVKLFEIILIKILKVTTTYLSGNIYQSDFSCLNTGVTCASNSGSTSSGLAVKCCSSTLCNTGPATFSSSSNLKKNSLLLASLMMLTAFTRV